ERGKGVSCSTTRSARARGVEMIESQNSSRPGASFAHSPCGPSRRGARNSWQRENISSRDAVFHRRIGVTRHSRSCGALTVTAARTKFVFEVLFDPNL